MADHFNQRRRTVLKSIGGAAAMLSPLASALAFAAGDKQLIVTDPGGPYGPAYRKAFYDPFEKATGIRVINSAREAQPLAQFTAMVQTRNYIWDVTTLTLSADVLPLEQRGLLEPLGLTAAAYPDLIPGAVRPDWLGVNVYGTVLAYRKDKYGANPPHSLQDFWDTKRFPGTRAMRRSALDSLEQALLADGVAADKLYPLDVDRAFKSLDRIKPHIAVWWTAGAQSTQLLQTGEADMVITWSSRAQTAIDNGAPVGIVWNQATYAIEGWGIPRGTPRAEYAKAFVKFCADPARQAVLANTVSTGPTNTKAFQLIEAQRAELLPTAADHIKNEVEIDAQWWTAHRDAVTERFTTWLIS